MESNVKKSKYPPISLPQKPYSASVVTFYRFPYILPTFSSQFVINPYPTYVFFSVCEKTENNSSPCAAYAAWARRRRWELVKIEVSRANNRRGIRPHHNLSAPQSTAIYPDLHRATIRTAPHRPTQKARIVSNAGCTNTNVFFSDTNNAFANSLYPIPLVS